MGKNNDDKSSQQTKQQTKFTLKKKKSIKDCYFYVGSNEQASDFEVTSEFIINHVKKTHQCGNDMSESLRKLEKLDAKAWKPKLQFSKSADQETKTQENRQLETEHETELDEVVKRRNKCQENIYTSYAELWERCAVSLKAKIEARAECKSKTHNDPVELLKAVKEHSLSCEDTRHDMRIILDAFRAHFRRK